MKLVRPVEMPPGPSLLLCREGRWVGTLGRLAFCLFLLGLGPLWWHWGVHWLWLVPWFGVVALLVPTMLGGIVTLWRESNWILRYDGSRVWVNLRSFCNAHFPEAETVVLLEASELTGARVHRERYSTPGDTRQSTSVSSKVQSVDLLLVDDQTELVAEAIKEERLRRPPPKSCLGLCKITHYVKDYPVSVPEPGVIRIAWRGPGSHVVPRAATVVERLMGRTGSETSDEKQWPDWKSLDDDQFDEQVKMLIQSGQTISAIKLLRQRRGLSLSETKQQVERIIEGQL